MRARDIRQTLAELALDTNEYRINAGGAMVLYGLREETHDLDIWCTKKLGDVLAQRCAFETMPGGTRRFAPAPDVEIYENLQPGETVLLDGIPVASLREVLAFKRSLNREKDQKDIAVQDAMSSAWMGATVKSAVCAATAASSTVMYNYYIKNTRITLEEEPVTPEEFAARIRRISESYPYLVARTDAGTVLGFAYLDVFNARSAYRCTADLSIYVNAALRRGGVGQRLYTELERIARARGIENIVSIITAENEGSLRFHRKNGFAEIGTMKAVAFKFGSHCDVSFLMKHLG